MKVSLHEQRSIEWFKDRLEKVTGSIIDGAMGNKKAQDTLITKLIGEYLTGENSDTGYSSKTMDRGTRAEPHAIKMYEEKMGLKIREVGMLISEEEGFEGWLAHSPDGYVIAPEEWKRSIEIKSPLASTVVKYTYDDGELREIPPEYINQFRSDFLVNPDLEIKDFVLYFPNSKNKKYQMLILTVHRKDIQKELFEMEEKLLLFRNRWLEKKRNYQSEEEAEAPYEF